MKFVEVLSFFFCFFFWFVQFLITNTIINDCGNCHLFVVQGIHVWAHFWTLLFYLVNSLEKVNCWWKFISYHFSNFSNESWRIEIGEALSWKNHCGIHYNYIKIIHFLFFLSSCKIECSSASCRYTQFLVKRYRYLTLSWGWAAFPWLIVLQRCFLVSNRPCVITFKNSIPDL